LITSLNWRNLRTISNLNLVTNQWLSCLGSSSGTYEHHYLLQLPINQTQSSRTSPTDQSTKNNNETQPVDIDIDTLAEKPEDTTLSDTDENPNDTEEDIENHPKKEYSNPCNDPELKNQKDWKEYCANKRYNDKLDAKQEQDEIEERAGEEYQESLKKWADETKRENEKLAQEYKKQREDWRAKDKKYDEEKKTKIASKLKKKKEFQKQQQLNIKFINKFTPSGEWSGAYKRIKKLDKTEDAKKSKKIYNAYKKIYYDSKQIKEQGKAEYQNAKANEIDKKAKYLNSVKDTSLTINKGLAKLDPTGTGEKIVTAMGDFNKVANGVMDATDLKDDLVGRFADEEE